jgi:hypothetical protein
MDRNLLYRLQAVKILPPVYFHGFQNYYFNRNDDGDSHILNSASEKQFGLVHKNQARLREEYNTWHSGRKSSATVHAASIRSQGIAAAGLILVVSTKNIIKTSVLDTGLCLSCFPVMNVP